MIKKVHKTPELAAAAHLISRARRQLKNDRPEVAERLLRSAAKLDRRSAEDAVEELGAAWWLTLDC